MDFIINYALGCNAGKERETNQDNFCVQGYYLKENHFGLDKIITGSADSLDFPYFCVFDGVGGASHGEVASFLAAETFSNYYQNNDKSNTELFCTESCKAMNRAICTFSNNGEKGLAGTTVAMTVFNSQNACVCNLGDSPVFLHNQYSIEKVSTDHISVVPHGLKPPITKSLGIPETMQSLEPSIKTIPLKDGDNYLICSDGLTDMVDMSTINSVLDSKAKPKKKVKTLLKAALKNGGFDNITIIICEIKSK
jgi:protein phosphatase